MCHKIPLPKGIDWLGPGPVDFHSSSQARLSLFDRKFGRGTQEMDARWSWLENQIPAPALAALDLDARTLTLNYE